MTQSQTGATAPGRGDTANWVLITGAGQAVRFIVSVVSTVLLGRLLLPADFGLIATAAPVIGLLELIRDLGFSQAIVQRKDIDARQGHALFWLTMLATTVLGLLLAVASPFASRFFHEPRLFGLLIAEACSMPLASISTQSWAWMNRQLRFGEIAMIDATQGIVGLVVTAVLAILTHSYWAIFFGSISTTLFGIVTTTWRSGWRPGLPRFDKGVFEMVRFGAGVSTSNLFSFFSRNADNLLIARAYGPVSLGLYDRAYKLMLLPLSQLSWPISRVLTPVLSRLQDDPVEYARTYLSTVSLMMMAIQPGVIMACLLSSSLISLLLGPNWSGSAETFAWLAGAAVHQVATSTLGWLYISQGRGRDYALSAAFNSVTTIIAFVMGLKWGPVGVAAAYAVSDYVIRAPFSWWFAGRFGPVTAGMMFQNACPHIAASLVVAAVLYSFLQLRIYLGVLGFIDCLLVVYILYAAILILAPAKRRLLGAVWNTLADRINNALLPAPKTTQMSSINFK